jgi:hypothetical protein
MVKHGVAVNETLDLHLTLSRSLQYPPRFGLGYYAGRAQDLLEFGTEAEEALDGADGLLRDVVVRDEYQRALARVVDLTTSVSPPRPCAAA